MQPAPGPFTPPPAATSQQIRPSLWWFGVAGGLAVVGIGGAIALFVVGIVRMTDRVDDFTRIAVPGTGTVQIDDPGGYTVYLEYPGASDDDFIGPFDPEVTVAITDPSGDDVLLEPYDSDVTYNFGGHEGEAVFSFDADEAGDYEVTTDGGATSEVAVGPGLGRSFVGFVVGALAVGGLGVVAGGVVAIVTGVRRSRSRRLVVAARMQQAAAGGPGAPGAGWGQPPGPAPAPWGAPGPSPAPTPGWNPPPASPAPPARPAPPVQDPPPVQDAPRPPSPVQDAPPAPASDRTPDSSSTPPPPPA